MTTKRKHRRRQISKTEALAFAIFQDRHWRTRRDTANSLFAHEATLDGILKRWLKAGIVERVECWPSYQYRLVRSPEVADPELVRLLKDACRVHRDLAQQQTDRKRQSSS